MKNKSILIISLIVLLVPFVLAGNRCAEDASFGEWCREQGITYYDTGNAPEPDGSYTVPSNSGSSSGSTPSCGEPGDTTPEGDCQGGNRCELDACFGEWCRKQGITFYCADDPSPPEAECGGGDPSQSPGGSGSTPTPTPVTCTNETSTETSEWYYLTRNEAPIADAGNDKTAYEGETITFDALGSSDDHMILSYIWNFGDGSADSGLITTYTYSTAGIYTVTLTVKDNGGCEILERTITETVAEVCTDGTSTILEQTNTTETQTVPSALLTDTDTATVTILPEPNTPPTIEVEDIELVEGTQTTIDLEQNSNDPDGDDLTFSFSENCNEISTSLTGSLLTIIADQQGVCTVTVYANDGKAADSDTFQVTVLPVTCTDSTETVTGDWYYVSRNQPPVANAGNDKFSIPGRTLTFDGSASTDDTGIFSYAWNFGDGNTDSGLITTHSYTTEGIYPITLTVTDNGGIDILERIISETVTRTCNNGTTTIVSQTNTTETQSAPSCPLSDTDTIIATIDRDNPNVNNTPPTIDVDDMEMNQYEEIEIDLREHSNDSDGDDLTFSVYEDCDIITTYTTGPILTIKSKLQGECTVSVFASDGIDTAMDTFKVTVGKNSTQKGWEVKRGKVSVKTVYYNEFVKPGEKVELNIVTNQRIQSEMRSYVHIEGLDIYKVSGEDPSRIVIDIPWNAAPGEYLMEVGTSNERDSDVVYLFIIVE